MILSRAHSILLLNGLGFDPALPQYDDARPPVTGYALASGVKADLDWHCEHYDTHDLTRAFGDEFGRLQNAPAGENREGLLGLYSYRRLVAERDTELVDSGEGDAAILDGYERFAEEDPRTVVLFSNDTGFVEAATERGLLAQKVAYPPDVDRRTTASWETIRDLLSVLTVVFGVIELPKATRYGVWDGEDGRHWKDEAVAVDCGLEVGGAQLVVGDQRPQGPKPRRVTDRLLHREGLLEGQPIVFGQRRVGLANLLGRLPVGFEQGSVLWDGLPSAHSYRSLLYKSLEARFYILSTQSGPECGSGSLTPSLERSGTRRHSRRFAARRRPSESIATDPKATAYRHRTAPLYIQRNCQL